jgi:hypothetical protein
MPLERMGGRDWGTERRLAGGLQRPRGGQGAPRGAHPFLCRLFLFAPACPPRRRTPPSNCPPWEPETHLPSLQRETLLN